MITGIIAAITSIFGSSAFGSLIGWVGGFLNRKVDAQLERDKMANDLALRELDFRLQQQRLDANERVAVIEGQAAIDTAAATATGQIERAAYAAMADSYEMDKATYNDRKVDRIRGLTRPYITWGFFALDVVMVILVAWLVWYSGVRFTNEQVIKLMLVTVDFVFFQSAVVIGWWFANRPTNNKYSIAP